MSTKKLIFNMATGRRGGPGFIAFFCLFSIVNHGLAQPGGRSSPVFVSQVISRKAASKSFVGTLVPLKRSTIGSAVDGRVTQIFVDEGDAIAVDETTMRDGEPLGQTLVQLRTVSLGIEIAAADVELRTREQAEKELQASLPTEIAAAESAVAEIQARLKYSESSYDRIKNLSETGGGVSTDEIDEATSQYKSLLRLNDGAESLLKKLQETSKSRRLQASLRVEAQKEEIKRLDDLRALYTIRAPFTGYVTAKLTERGQWVSRGDPVMEVIQLNPIELVIPVPQTYIQLLQKSLDEARKANSRLMALVTVESVPQLLEGEVVRIVPQADLRSRSFPVRIRINNPKTDSGHLLKAGMLARASLLIDGNDEILLVKKDALVLGGLQNSLYVVEQDPETQSAIAKLVSVEVGGSIEDWIQVIGDIKLGDQVVVLGNERLLPGQPITVAKEIIDSLPGTSGSANSSANN